MLLASDHAGRRLHPLRIRHGDANSPSRRAAGLLGLSMNTFKLSRVNSFVVANRYFNGVLRHSWSYGVSLTGSSADRRRQFRALARQFTVTHG